jgi:hypothetical protein
MEISLLIIFSYIAVLFFILLIMISKFNDYADLKKKENINLSSGSWHGGIFFSRPPIPIEDKSENHLIQKAVSNHNKIIIVFWIWALMIIPIIVFLNITD